MKAFAVFFILILNLLVNCDELVEKPSWMKTCARKDPDFDQCHLESIQILFQNVLLGNYKIKGIDSLEPVSLAKVQILQGSGPVSLDASLSDLRIAGMSNGEIVNVTADFEKFNWQVVMKIPKIRIDANYQMKGQILVIPLNGKGKCFMELTDVKVRMRSKSNVIEKNGHPHFDIADLQISFKMEGLKLRFSNLFEGSKELDQTINQYLNENWKAALDALKPIILKTIQDILYPIVKSIYDHIPGDYIVSDIRDYVKDV